MSMLTIIIGLIILIGGAALGIGLFAFLGSMIIGVLGIVFGFFFKLIGIFIIFGLKLLIPIIVIIVVLAFIIKIIF